MKIKEIKVEELKEYENNPRHNDGAVDAVAESIKQFGFKVPIVVDKNNVIVAGHTRLKAARKLGLVTVPCIVADDLTDEQIKAFRLADNKTAELAEWDFSALEAEIDILSEHFDMSAFGFDVSNYSANDSNYEHEEIELDREEIGTAQKLPQIKFGSTTILLTELEYTRFTTFYNRFLRENGNAFGLIAELLDNGAKNYES